MERADEGARRVHRPSIMHVRRPDHVYTMINSYTIQPIISRDGRLVGPLLICLQEARGLDVRVRPRVEELVREYGNIQVYWSSSGKMDGGLILRWMREILGPEIASNLRNVTNQIDMNSASRTLDPTYDPRDDPFVDQASLDCHQNVMRRAKDQLPCMHFATRGERQTHGIARKNWCSDRHRLLRMKSISDSAMVAHAR
jgi:hypothetical protein